MKKICIVIDAPDRDLDQNILIASRLVNKNYEVVFVEYYKLYEIFLINPDCIILQHCRENYLQIMKECKKKDIKIIILESEGGYGGVVRYPKKFDNSILLSKKYFDLYFCWGKKIFKRVFKKIPLAYKNKLKLTGSPKNDLLTRRYDDYFLKDKKKFIIFSSAFPNVNPKFVSFKENYQSMINTGFYNKNEADNLIKDSFFIQSKFVNLILKTSKILKKKNIIIRVHPFENPNFYINKFSKIKNIRISSNGNIIPLLKSAEHLVQYDCQTAFDFYATGKLSISYDFYLNKKLRTSLPDVIKKISLKPKDEDQFLQILKSNSIKNKSKNKRYYEDIFYKNDGKAINRVIKHIIDLKIKKKQNLFLKNILYTYNFYDKLKIMLRLLIGNNNLLMLKKMFTNKSNAKTLDFNYIKKKISILTRNKFEIKYFKNTLFNQEIAAISIRLENTK